MNTNPYFLSIATGIVVFLMMTVIKRNKKENVDRSELFKISAVVSILCFGILQFYDKKPLPTLTEPFTSLPSES